MIRSTVRSVIHRYLRLEASKVQRSASFLPFRWKPELPSLTASRQSITTGPEIAELGRENEGDTQKLEEELHRAIQSHQEALETCEKGSVYLRESLTALSKAYASLRRWEDAIAAWRALEDHQPEKPHDVYKHFEHLGNLQHKAGQTQDAIASLQLATRALADTPDFSFPSQAMGSLQNALAGIMLQSEESQDMQKIAMLLRKAQENFGYAFHRYIPSEEEQLGGLSVEPSVLPGSNEDNPQLPKELHPDLVKIMENQGLVYRMMGDMEMAHQKYVGAVTILNLIGRDKFSKDETDSLRLDIADCMMALGNDIVALDTYEEMLKEAEAGTAIEATLRHCIGRVWMQRQNYTAAIDEFNKSYRIKQEVAGLMHPEVGKTLNVLGVIYAALGQNYEADQCFREALAIARVNVPSHIENEQDDPMVQNIMRNMSLVKRGRRVEDDELQQESEDDLEGETQKASPMQKILGDTEPPTGRRRRRRGPSVGKQQDFQPPPISG